MQNASVWAASGMHHSKQLYWNSQGLAGKMGILTSALYSSSCCNTVIQCLCDLCECSSDYSGTSVSSVFLFVTAFLLLLVLQGCAQLLDEHWQHLVQRVHHTPLQPLGNCSPSVVEAKFLQDVVHTHWVNLASCPGNEPEDRGNV